MSRQSPAPRRSPPPSGAGPLYGSRYCLLLKPDAFRSPGIPEAVLKAYELDGFEIARSRHELTQDEIEAETRKELFRRHYAEHEGKDFYEALVAEMARGIVQVYELRHREADRYGRARTIMWGLRDLYGHDARNNTLHMSDSAEAAERELTVWFTY